MAIGTMEMIANGTEYFIKGLGIKLDLNVIETVDDEFAADDQMRGAQAELVARVSDGTIEIKDEGGTVVPFDKVGRWIRSAPLNDAAPPIPLITYYGTFRQRVPNNGNLWLAHNQSVTMTEVGFIIPGNTGTIRTMFFGSKQADNSRTYDLRIWENPATSPSLVVSNVLTTTLGQRTKTVTDLDIELPAGEYGMRLRRVTGSGRSTFNQGMANVIMEIR